jgi:hypothetical protein
MGLAALRENLSQVRINPIGAQAVTIDTPLFRAESRYVMIRGQKPAPIRRSPLNLRPLTSHLP